MLPVDDMSVRIMTLAHTVYSSFVILAYAKARATQHMTLMTNRYQCLTTVFTKSGRLMSSLLLFCVDDSMGFLCVLEWMTFLFDKQGYAE